MSRRMMILAVVFWSAGTAIAQVADLSGTWVLNVDKSDWGKLRKPVASTVTVQHKDPAISYSGMLTSSEGEETLTFEFKGAIDGREYPVKRSMGSGKVRINRTDERTLNSVFKSDDGRWTETAKTSISTDGRTMRRTIRQDSPSGKMEWTEVYERR